LSVGSDVEQLPRPVRESHARRLRNRRIIVSALIVGLTLWLAGAALAHSSGPIEKALLLLMATLLPIHLVMWQLGGMNHLNQARGSPRALQVAVALIALGSSPLVIYPVGALAVLVAIFSGGGAAAPALTVTGLLMLSPIILLLLIALLFVASGYKGG
jgi:hypothetical protein